MDVLKRVVEEQWLVDRCRRRSRSLSLGSPVVSDDSLHHGLEEKRTVRPCSGHAMAQLSSAVDSEYIYYIYVVDLTLSQS